MYPWSYMKIHRMWGCQNIILLHEKGKSYDGHNVEFLLQTKQLEPFCWAQ